MDKDTVKALGVPVRVAGIPALAYVRYYDPGRAGVTTGEPWSYATIQAPEPAEVEYEIYDRRGYRALWLEQMATDNVDQQVLAELNDAND